MDVTGEAQLRIVEAVVFDLDGTLIDSIDVYVKILNEAFSKLGLPPVSRNVTVDAMRYGGFDWDRVLPSGSGDQRAALVERVRRLIMETYQATFRREAGMIPGAARILQEAAARGFRVGLVTATQRIYLHDKLYPLRRTNSDTYLEVMITTDDVTRQKPAADPLIECARRLGVQPSRMAYVGDSRIDVQAGKAAGALTVGVLTGVEERAALLAEGPDHLLESVRELGAIMAEWARHLPF